MGLNVPESRKSSKSEEAIVRDESMVKDELVLSTKWFVSGSQHCPVHTYL